MWLSQKVYSLLTNQLAGAQNRITALEQSLELERHESRLAERHWANALLRARQAYPMQPDKPAPAAKPLLGELVDLVDPGERDALIAAARDMGFENPASEADRILREERGGFVS